MSNITEAHEALNLAIDAVGEVPCQNAPDIFFGDIEQPNALLNTKMAKKMCKDCPVINLCLEYAVVGKETFGVWGGTAPEERKKLMRIRKAGRASARQQTALAG